MVTAVQVALPSGRGGAGGDCGSFGFAACGDRDRGATAAEFACRVDRVAFTGQYLDHSTTSAFACTDACDTPPVPAGFRDDMVAVENDSISDFYLSSIASARLAPNIRRVAGTGDATTALPTGNLMAGEVMAAMGPRAQVECWVSVGGEDARAATAGNCGGAMDAGAGGAQAAPGPCPRGG